MKQFILFLYLILQTSVVLSQESSPTVEDIQSLIDAGQQEKAQAIVENLYQAHHKKEEIDSLIPLISLSYYAYNGYDRANKIVEEVTNKSDDAHTKGKAYFIQHDLYKNNRNMQEALQAIQQAGKHWESLDSAYLTGLIYHNIGHVYQVWGKVDSSIVYFKKALPYYKKNKDAAGANNIASLIRNIAVYYEQIDDNDTAENYYKQGLKDLSKKDSLNYIEGYYFLTKSLARVFELKNDYDKANDVMVETIKQLKSYHPIFKERNKESLYYDYLVSCYGLLSSISKLSGNFKASRYVEQEINNIVNKSSLNKQAESYKTYLVNKVYNNHFLRNHTATIQAAKELLGLLKNENEHLSSKKYMANTSIGKAFYELGKYDSAAVYLKRAKHNYDDSDTYKDYFQMESEFDFLEMFCKSGRADEAIKGYNQIVTDYYNFPIVPIYYKIYNLIQLPKYLVANEEYNKVAEASLTAKAYLDKYIKSGDLSAFSQQPAYFYLDLQKEIANFKIAVNQAEWQTAEQSYLKLKRIFELCMQYSKDYSLEALQVYLDFHEIINPVISAAEDMYSHSHNEDYLNDISYFNEIRTNNDLFQSHLKNYRFITSQLPEELKQREIHLLSELKKLDESNGEDKVNRLEQLDSLLMEKRAFQKKIEKDYPKYLEFKYGLPQKIYNDVINALDPAISYVQFYQSGEVIKALLFQNEKVSLLDDPNWSIDVIKAIDIAVNKQVDLSVFDSLFEQITNQRIVILPEVFTSVIPFELNEKISDSSVISYSTVSMLGKKSPKGSRLMSVASDYSADSLLNQPHIIQLLKRLCKHNGGKFIMSNQMSKEDFLKQIQTYDLAFFGGHTKYSTTDPMSNAIMMNFSNQNDSIGMDEINLYDILGLERTPNSVSLISCSTGVGGELSGRGLLSLSRGMVHQGTNSILQTLWDVDEKATSEILDYYLKYIKKNKRKDDALRLAKKDFIANAPERLKHPYYWAGIVIMGDVSPYNLQAPLYHPSNLWKIGLAIIFLIFVFFLVKRKSGKQLS